jgi:hypothetical protein
MGVRPAYPDPAVAVGKSFGNRKSAQSDGIVLIHVSPPDLLRTAKKMSLELTLTGRSIPSRARLSMSRSSSSIRRSPGSGSTSSRSRAMWYTSHSKVCGWLVRRANMRSGGRCGHQDLGHTPCSYGAATGQPLGLRVGNDRRDKYSPYLPWGSSFGRPTDVASQGS